MRSVRIMPVVRVCVYESSRAAPSVNERANDKRDDGRTALGARAAASRRQLCTRRQAYPAHTAERDAARTVWRNAYAVMARNSP